jgi:uncharacterized protein YjiS (DUF1127 family)
MQQLSQRHSNISHQINPSHEGLVSRAAEMYWLWRERHRSRANLIGLPDADLKDLGLSRGDAEKEWEKPFWRS